MTALPAEVEGAMAEGVEMMTLKAPARLEIEDGKLKGIWVTPQMISRIKDGRAFVVPTGEPDELIPCDTLIVAIGQNIETKHYEESGTPCRARQDRHSSKRRICRNPRCVLPAETVPPGRLL